VSVAASLLSLSLIAETANAQNTPPATSGFALTLPNIMRGPEHYGREPQNVQWSPDGQYIYFQWTPAGSKWDDRTRLYRVRPQAGATPEIVSDASADTLSPMLAPGATSRNRQLRAVSTRGDLYLVDLVRSGVRRLTETAAAETSPQFSADERHLLYSRDGNAYSLELATGAIRQLTDIRTGPAPRDSTPPTGVRGAIERDQRDLLEVIRDRARVDSIQRVERELAEARVRLRPVYLPSGERLASISIAPSLKSAVVLTATNPPGQPRLTQVPNYVTASGFTENIGSRTKVGEGNVRFRAYVLDLSTNRLRQLHTVGGDSTKAASQIRVVSWNDAGNTALLQAGTPDFKWRYFMSMRDDGTVRTIDALRDSAWIGGPCAGCAGWLPDGRAWFASEATGYMHLYSADADGGNKRALTSGKWEVLQATVAPDGRSFELHTSEESPYVRHFYRMPIAGGTRQKITREHGGHQVEVSPDGRRLADVFSTANTPPELYVLNADGTAPVRLTTSTSEEFRKGPWIKPAIVQITASDGVQVPARIYRPQDMNAQPNGAAVIFVHGAGYLHNVHDYWSSYSREYMFHHLLASKGYTVLDVDYRASAGYGRDWRTAVYRWMGGRDLADHVDASRWLQKQHNISPERIGIYGGSYGGFMTLMALFNAPKEFGAGAALRSVTDWAHYNHGYTGSILNLPQDDTLAYRRSSPIFFAQGLEDPLLMAHGMIDTNVHFQDIVRLSQRLIELGKTGWELAVYPVEDHGFTRPSSWTDEYRRIMELFDNTIGPNGSKAKR
jgi:dipeptidyl aminopeptidase/acylaminoacyl peptidase